MLIIAVFILSMATFILTAADIETAFTLLNEQLKHQQISAECFLIGGAVMCLAFHARPATKDVDGWFTEPQAVRTAAKIVAQDLNLPEDWLNDAAKGFIPTNAGFECFREYSHLKVSVADEHTLLAMKCAAARSQEDTNDIIFLCKRLGLKTANEVIAIVLHYYPIERLPIRTQLLLEEIFQ